MLGNIVKRIEWQLVRKKQYEYIPLATKEYRHRIYCEGPEGTWLILHRSGVRSLATLEQLFSSQVFFPRTSQGTDSLAGSEAASQTKAAVEQQVSIRTALSTEHVWVPLIPQRQVTRTASPCPRG